MQVDVLANVVVIWNAHEAVQMIALELSTAFSISYKQCSCWSSLNIESQKELVQVKTTPLKNFQFWNIPTIDDIIIGIMFLDLYFTFIHIEFISCFLLFFWHCIVQQIVHFSMALNVQSRLGNYWWTFRNISCNKYCSNFLQTDSAK